MKSVQELRTQGSALSTGTQALSATAPDFRAPRTPRVPPIGAPTPPGSGTAFTIPVIPSTSARDASCVVPEGLPYDQLRYVPMESSDCLSWVPFCGATGSRRLGTGDSTGVPVQASPRPRLPLLLRYEENRSERRLVAELCPTAISHPLAALAGTRLIEAARSCVELVLRDRQFHYATDTVLQHGPLDQYAHNILPRYLALDYWRYDVVESAEIFLGVVAADRRIWQVRVGRVITNVPTSMTIPRELAIGAARVVDFEPVDIACHLDRVVVSGFDRGAPSEDGAFPIYILAGAISRASWTDLRRVEHPIPGARFEDKTFAPIDIDRTTDVLYVMQRGYLSALDRSLRRLRTYDFNLAFWPSPAPQQGVDPHIGGARIGVRLSTSVFEHLAPVAVTSDRREFGETGHDPARTPLAAPSNERSFPPAYAEFCVENNLLLFENFTDPQLDDLSSLWLFRLGVNCVRLLAVVNPHAAAGGTSVFTVLPRFSHLSFEPWQPWFDEYQAVSPRRPVHGASATLIAGAVVDPVEVLLDRGRLMVAGPISGIVAAEVAE
jgi:hypothetical protein